MDAKILSAFNGTCVRAVFAVVLCLGICIFVFCYKPFDFAKRHPTYSDAYIATLQNTEKRVVTIAKIVAPLLLLGVVVFSALPCVRDTIAIHRQEFHEVTGQVVRVTNVSDASKPDVVVVQDAESGKEMRFKVFLPPHSPAEGTHVAVTYLAGTKYAVLRESR